MESTMTNSSADDTQHNLSVIDVACYILDHFGEMTTMKLQKLVYYCQAYHLAWRDRPLFHEPIRAWTHGPVVYELFNAHRGMNTISANDLANNNASTLNDIERDVVDNVCETFHNLTGWELRNHTRKEAPWRNNFHKEAARHNQIIPRDQMQQFYAHSR